MGKRGRPAAIESQKIIDAILARSKEIITSKNRSIVEKTNPVWKSISDQLKNAISSLSLYSYVTDNRFEIRNKLYENEGILPDISINSNNTTADDSVNLSDASNSCVPENITRSYKIFLSKEVFQSLIVVKTRKRPTGRNKKLVRYKGLKPGVWEDVINDLLVDSTKITCGLSFKTHFISVDESYGSFKAHCACGSRIDGVIKNDNFNTKFVEIVCTIYKGSGICGKRWLRNERRKKTINEMGEKTVHLYRAEKAAEKMEEGDTEPPNLPSSPVLRTAKSQARNKQYIDRDPIKALQIMKLNDAAHIIRQIGLDKFFVHYWTRHQLAMYKDYVNKGSSCLCIDATGKIVRRIKHNGKVKLRPIYVYHGVVGFKEAQFPVVQMISEAHDSSTIKFWLTQWIKSGAASPKEIVIDGGRAIITAAVQAFTNYSTISDYADACYDSNVPSCYIRIDNAHFINTYVKLLGNVPRQVGTFYKAVMGQLIICQDLETAKKIIRSLLLVSQCETEGNLRNEKETDAEKAKNYLMTLITDDNRLESIDDDEYHTKDDELSQSDTEESDNDSLNSDNSTNDKQKSKKKTKITNQWTEIGEQINEEVQTIIKTQKGNRVNPFYFLKFAEKLLTDLRDLPLWSCVARPKFGYGRVPPSSSSVESEFNILKNYSFLKNLALPIRVDDYVARFIDYINGRLKLLDAKIYKTAISEKEDHEVESNSSFDLSEKDNNSCPVCANGDHPTGNHKCFICHKPVHNLDSCSHPLDINEGFGQRRICFPCQKAGSIDIIIAGREKENWGNEVLKLPREEKKISLQNSTETNTKTKKKVAKYYGEKRKQINEELLIQETKIKKITILKNGSCDGLSPVNFDGNRVTAIWTCPFDSVYQLIVAAICDWSEFREKVQQQKKLNTMFDFALTTLKKGITAATYKNRAKFHYDFIEHRIQPDGSILLECVTNVETIIMKTFAKTPSVEITIECDRCKLKKQRNVIAPLIYKSDMGDHDIDLTKLDNLSMKTPCKAKGCKGTQETSISSIGNIIVFEVFDDGTNAKVKLNTLPRSVKNPLNTNDIYRLVGAVDYTPPFNTRRSSTDKIIGHFTAVCLRGMQWTEYDDRIEKEIYKKNTGSIIPRILMYVKIN